MKKLISTLAALFIFLNSISAIDFYKGTYHQALAKGKAENKPLFLYFTAKWCGPCQYMQHYIFPDTTLSTYIKQNYIALKLDIDTEEGKLVYHKSHQIKGSTGVPAFIIMNSKEEVLKKALGGMKLEQLKSFLMKDETQKVMYKAMADSLATLQIKANIKPPTFISKLFFNAQASNWKPGLKIGANLMGLTKNNRGIGYDFGLFYDRSFKYLPGTTRGFWHYSRYHFQPGISFSSQGEQDKRHYLTLELFNGYQIKGLRRIEFTLSPYAAIGLREKFKSAFDQLDYGLKGGLAKQYGTGQINLGYTYGLKDISRLSTTSLYNQGFYLSFALIVGK